MKKFHLTVSSVTEPLFDDEAVSVIVPGIDGEAEILADHEPFITKLKEGVIVIKKNIKDKPGSEEKFEIEKGILEVANNQAVILV